MSKRILATLATCALMVGAVIAPATSDAKARHAKHAKEACIFQPIDDALGQIEANLAPIIRIKLRLCGPIS
jgi:hypothetical protein